MFIGQIGFDPGSRMGKRAGQHGRQHPAPQGYDLRWRHQTASNAFDPSVEWDGFATDTFDGLGAHTASCGPATQEPKLNEFSASTTGADVEYVEVFGSPDTDYSAYTVLEIEGDGTGSGVVDEVIPVGTTDAAGFWLGSLAANALENGTLTLLLVKDFTGALGNDLDTNNDGVFDVTPWSAIVDAVAVNDGGAGDLTYGIPSLGAYYDGLALCPWRRFALPGRPGHRGCHRLGAQRLRPGRHPRLHRHDRSW